MTHDNVAFFLSWMAAPRRIAAITPSGKAAAELVTRDLEPEAGPVVELGPGTGVLSYKLLENGFRQQDLILVERDLHFANLLQTRFPGAQVLWMDAARLRTATLADASVGAVVSSLPLTIMPPRQVFAILKHAFRYLRPAGGLYQLTYGPAAPIPSSILERLGLTATLIGRTMSNLPPAAVYKVERWPGRASIADTTSTERQLPLPGASSPHALPAGGVR